jgi:predicted ABC-type ATPase
MSKKIYIVSGCNGAGKTTASYTILPEILDCKEFVNADEIAKGLSPFQPEKVAFEAGRIMLQRLDDLLLANENFAFETTLASRTFASFINRAKALDYEVTLLFFWLSSKELAANRVKTRVAEGGHNIPVDVIERRYDRGLLNFFELYLPLVNNWMFVDNSGTPYREIGQSMNGEVEIVEKEQWNKIKGHYGK